MADDKDIEMTVCGQCNGIMQKAGKTEDGTFIYRCEKCGKEHKFIKLKNEYLQ